MFFILKISLGVREQTTEPWKVLAIQGFSGKISVLPELDADFKKGAGGGMAILQLNICIGEFLSHVRQGIF